MSEQGNMDGGQNDKGKIMWGEEWECNKTEAGFR